MPDRNPRPAGGPPRRGLLSRLLRPPAPDPAQDPDPDPDPDGDLDDDPAELEEGPTTDRPAPPGPVSSGAGGEWVSPDEIEVLEEGASPGGGGGGRGQERGGGEGRGGHPRSERQPGALLGGTGGGVFAFSVLTWALAGALATGEDADLSVLERIGFGAVPIGLPGMILGALMVRRAVGQGGQAGLRAAAIGVTVLFAVVAFLAGYLLPPVAGIVLALWAADAVRTRKLQRPRFEPIAVGLLSVVPVYIVVVVAISTPPPDLEVVVAGDGSCSMVDGDLIPLDEDDEPIVQDGTEWTIRPEADRYGVEVTNDSAGDAAVHFEGTDVDDEPGFLELAVPPGEMVRGVLPELGEGTHTLSCGSAGDPDEISLLVEEAPEDGDADS